jgi:hypothetical protein
MPCSLLLSCLKRLFKPRSGWLLLPPNRLQELAALKQQLKAELEPEPAEGEQEAAEAEAAPEGSAPPSRCVVVRVRLPDGSTHTRRWLRTTPMGKVRGRRAAACDAVAVRGALCLRACMAWTSAVPLVVKHGPNTCTCTVASGAGDISQLAVAWLPVVPRACAGVRVGAEHRCDAPVGA